MRVIIIMALLTAVMLLSVIMITQVAYGQQNNIVAAPPIDTHFEDSDRIIEEIQLQLQYSQLKDYKLYENGTAEYTIQLLSAQGRPIENRTMDIITTHRFTPQYGYIYNASGVFTPQGERLVISTFDDED
jgi:hypothetical protein